MIDQGQAPASEAADFLGAVAGQMSMLNGKHPKKWDSCGLWKQVFHCFSEISSCLKS